jgi:NAD(P)H-nitrite reductase large subunit
MPIAPRSSRTDHVGHGKPDAPLANATHDPLERSRRVGEIMRRPRVLIAGGGVAGLETLLALRALAADRVDITILAPELKFVNRSMAVDQPFKRQRVRGIRLQNAAAELDTRWHRGALDRVEHEQHRVVTKDGYELPYDMLVLAIGAHPEREWAPEEVLTYHGGSDAPATDCCSISCARVGSIT